MKAVIRFGRSIERGVLPAMLQIGDDNRVEIVAVVMGGADGFCASSGCPGVMTVDDTWMKRPSTGVILVVAALTADRHIVQLGLAWVKGRTRSHTRPSSDG